MFYPGQQFGRYTLVKQLGKGAYGEVWLAMRHAKFVTTKVAIKLPTAHVDFDAIRQEAILWEQASGHPNVLPIIEADEFDGQVVIVSEYASDGTLDDYLARAGKLPVRKAVEMAIGIAQGLEFLHSRRIVHRDIKPANVLLQGDTPRLTDFGMSRVVLGSAVSLQVSGTPYYMAPEAYNRKRDRQTDIWSLGVVIYEMLTGAMPFPGEEVDEICRAVLNDKPLPMPKSTPSPLRNLILKMLEKSPADRYQNVTEIREELQRMLPELPAVTAEDVEIQEAPGNAAGPERRRKHSDFKRSQFVPEPATASRKPWNRTLLIAAPALILIFAVLAASVYFLTRPDPIPFRKGDKFGFVSAGRKPLIPANFDFARPFEGGRAVIGIGPRDESGRFNGKFGFIDASGNPVTPVEFDHADSFTDGLALIAMTDSTGVKRFGYIDLKGKMVVDPTFEEARPFRESFAAVRFQGKWGFIDKHSASVIPFRFDDAGSFTNGFAPVRIDGRYGYINRHGDFVIPPSFDRAGPFAEGKAPVGIGERAFFIDTTGAEVIAANYSHAGPFEGGVAVVVSGGKAGFIDVVGNQLVPFTYEYGSAVFSEGAVAVPLNGRFGYVNQRGAVLIPFRYLEAGPFKNGLALVRSTDGKEFYISSNGNEYHEP